MVASELTEFNRKESSVELEASYPVVVTDKLIECRDFYTRWFGFRVVFEATWFVYLTSSEEGQHGIAFMTPDHPSRPPDPEAFDNEGILLTFQVPDAHRSSSASERPDSSSTTRCETNRGVRGDSDSKTRRASGWTCGADRSRAGLLGSVHLTDSGRLDLRTVLAHERERRVGDLTPAAVDRQRVPRFATLTISVTPLLRAWRL